MPVAVETKSPYHQLADDLLARFGDHNEPQFLFEPAEPGFHTLVFCMPTRRGAVKYLLEMVTLWLIPGRRLNLPQVFVKEYDDVTVGEISIETGEREPSFSMLEHELKMGALSQYHANRILELKVLTVHEKMSHVQELLTDCICRFPAHFDHDLFATFHRFIQSTTEAFRKERSVRYLTRLVAAIYLLQNRLQKNVEEVPEKRHMCIKLLRTNLHDVFGEKHVLGIFVGLNFLRENEVFAKKHLLRAVQEEIEGVQESLDVAFSYADEQLQFLYVEVEKISGASFTTEELRILKRELPVSLRGRIEHLLRPVFMPRNEEEVMRDVITLAKQLKYKRDLPQLIINFDEQTDREIVFTLILARVLHEESAPIETLLGGIGQIEKVRNMGKLRKRYPKEVTVVRAALPIRPFIRDDETVDLAKAREQLLFSMQDSVGAVRDFNGGMLSKQAEALNRLRDSLGPIAKENALLLENFFHAIFPVEFRAVVDQECLKTLFLMLVHQLERDETKEVVCKEDRERVYVLVASAARKEQLLRKVSQHYALSIDLVMLQYQGYDRVFLGYIYRESDPKKRDAFLRLCSQ